LHAWLELIEWIEDGEPDDGQLRQTAARIDCRVADLEGEIEAFRKILRQPRVRETLSRRSYRPVHRSGIPEPLATELSAHELEPTVYRELPFALRQGAELVHGIIDRVVVLRTGDRAVAADVIDFKSDKVAEKGAYTVDEAVEHYASQLRVYREAVSRLFRLPVDRVATRLLFLTPDVLRSVE
ncbi:MAG TPA: hypothetical protein EYP14_13905, partial [Planctomycetaceae bacterium]|nr:hypothetical protein [Planctomycetaceae bacterium]